MAEVDKARRVLEGERQEVLAALRKNRADRQRVLARLDALTAGETPLLVRGMAAGLSVSALSKALGKSRAVVYERLADEEKGRKR